MEVLEVSPKKWKTVPSRSWKKIVKKPEAVRINNEVDITVYVQRLEAAFQNDLTIQEACDYAGLPRSTFYDHLKKDKDFAARMEKAKRFPLLKAKQRATEIISKGADRDAGPMIRWLLEKRQPEIYAPTQPAGGSNTQNNFFILTNEQISVLGKQPDIINGDPSELLEVLEANAVAARSKEESTSSLHPESP